MADFVSSFWSWFVIVLTVAGIAGLFWLNRWMTTPGAKTKNTDTTGHVWDGDLRELNNPLPRWWLNLFYLTLFFGIAYLLLYPGLGSFAGLLGWTSKQRYENEVAAAEAEYGALYAKYLAQDISSVATDPDAVKTGERLFVNYCAGCHGSDARGVPGGGYPNLRDDDWLWGGDPQTIKTTIANGRSGAMPPWGPVLGEAGVAEVAEYVVSLSGKRPVNKALALSGKTRFQQLCVACHGVDGKGNVALGAPNLTDDVWLFGGTTKAIRRSVEQGRNSRMPAHLEFLGEGKVHVLAAYVYSLSQTNLKVAKNDP